jgi:magnesium transporter
MEEFGLRPLAVVDAISPHQRPKVDRCRSHLFASMYAVLVSSAWGCLGVAAVVREIALRLGPKLSVLS